MSSTTRQNIRSDHESAGELEALVPTREHIDLMDRVGEKILRHFGANLVTVIELDRVMATARVLGSWNLPHVEPMKGQFSLDTFYPAKLIAELSAGRTVAVADVTADSRTEDVKESYLAVGVRSSLHAPFPIDGRFLFKLAVHDGRPREWTRDERDLCRELAASIYQQVERSRASIMLRKSEERLRLATEAAEMFVWEADLVRQKMTWDDSAAKVLGCKPEELSADFQDSWFFIHPDEREQVNQRFFDALHSGERHFVIEYRGVDKGGRSTFWRVQAFLLLDGDNNPVRLIGTTQNVSAQKKSELLLQESEERLRLILDSVTDHAIVALNDKGLITGWNPGAMDVFGFSAAEIIGQPTDILFTPEDRAAGVPAKELITARTTGRAEDERWHLRKDGSRFYASGVMGPLKGVPGFVKVARDLTKKQRTEDELRKAREELEERVRERTRELDESNAALRQEILDRVKAEAESVGLLRKIVTTQEDERGRIARDLHDQLGQRLTALRLNIASLRDACGDNAEMCSRVDSLEELGARLDADVNFLAWELRPRVLDDLGLVSAVESFVREWSQHFSIPADFHSSGLFEKRLDHEIETNLYRITQEALNNIFKHARPTSVSVLLERRGREVVLVVEDNGVGFDTSNTQTDRESGRGLGLIGMSERAAIVGGRLEVESARGEGTTIFVRVPAKFTNKGKRNGSKNTDLAG